MVANVIVLEAVLLLTKVIVIEGVLLLPNVIAIEGLLTFEYCLTGNIQLQFTTGNWPYPLRSGFGLLTQRDDAGNGSGMWPERKHSIAHNSHNWRWAGGWRGWSRKTLNRPI